MKKLPFVTWTAISLVALCLPAARAEDLTPPIVANPIADVTVAVGSAPTVIKVKNTFALQGVTGGEVVRFTTSLGNIDVELYPATTPKTVANFLGYVNRGDASKGGYNYSLIQRVAQDPPVVQGGGYYVSSNGVETLIPQADIRSEAGISNTTGTIAMALSAGPNTANSAWFFNLADNTGLDGTVDGGPFTVFGRVIGNGMETIDAIVALKDYNLSASLGAAFASVPLLDSYKPSAGATPQDLVYTESIAVIPLTATSTGGPALLKLKVLSNTNPHLVQASLIGRKLKLTYPGQHTGAATITLQAKDSARKKVATSFNVTVQ